MNIETIYNVGDIIWFMNDNKPKQIDITGIRIDLIKKYTCKISFDLGKPYGSYTCEHMAVPLSQLFPTKEALLASL